ncbi:MAG: transcription termination/antitermination protein NusG [Candidatus Cloacimonetes bacterium]|nr:transcription termination/antitermination protein NusG [Candidatus Cloacimonadota bacterium]
MNWYVLHVYSARESRIKEAIEKSVAGTDMEKDLGEILIPTQKTFHIRDGKKVQREKKIFNSYIIIQANLTPELTAFILNMPGVTHFLGSTKKPVPLSEIEAKRLLGISDREDETEKDYQFIQGDMVKIISGPFTEFEGVIEKVSQDSHKLTVNVAVFGRVTPVELNTDQVERINKI